MYFTRPCSTDATMLADWTTTLPALATSEAESRSLRLRGGSGPGWLRGAWSGKEPSPYPAA